MSFQNVRLVSKGADPSQYHTKQEVERGSAKYVMSSGELRIFAQCPSRYRLGYNPPDSKAKQWGSLLDTMLLTPEQFKNRYVIRPETYKDKDGDEKKWAGNATACKKWIADHSDVEVVKSIEVKNCGDAIKRLQVDEVIKAYVDASDKQVWLSGEWKDEATGIVVPVKCLLDLVPRLGTEFENTLGDLKSTRNASLLAWQRWCFSAGYHLQAAFYTDLYVALTGEDRNTWCFIVQENFAPWQTAKRMLSQDFLDLGRSMYKRLLSNYCACVKHDRWPSYDDHDEAIQSWSLVAPEPFMQERAMFAPHFEFEADDEQEDTDGDLVP